MRIGVPKEIKTHEYRVGLTPASVRELVEHGHEVLIETAAGDAIGLVDALYQSAGARIAANAEEVFAAAELIVKVKEPQAEERTRLREGQVLFTYLHLAPDPEQTNDLIASGCVAIAYETVTDARGGLPLLAPMSAVAGRMSIQAGAHSLELAQGGSGVLLPGVPGVAPGRILIIGGGRGRQQRRPGGARHRRARRAARALGAPDERARPRVRHLAGHPLLHARNSR